jgi:hypothetical protein
MDDTLTSNDAADRVRTYRMFSGLLSNVLGVEPDQNYASEDAWIGAPVGYHVTADPYRGAAIQGKSITVGNGNAQPQGLVIPPVLLLLGLGLFLMSKKG